MRMSLLVGHSDLRTFALSLTNETEYMGESFRAGTVSPSYSLNNETEYMGESFRPGSVSPSYNLTNKTVVSMSQADSLS